MLTAAGVLYPATGLLSKQEGVRLAKFGPLQSWTIHPNSDGYQARAARSLLALPLRSLVRLAPLLVLWFARGLIIAS